MKIKQNELANKNNLLAVENDRLNSFLNDTVLEVGQLSDEIFQSQMKT